MNMSKALIKITPYVPSEFVRTPRELKYTGSFKATECRMIALYTGIVFLKDFVHEDVYEHFLLFHCAYRLFADPIGCRNNASVAQQMLEIFVAEFAVIYGPQFVSYNIHNLLHISQNVDHCGCLSSVSAYPCENYMQELKKFKNSGNQVLQQLHRRISEIENLNRVLKDCNQIQLGGLIEPKIVENRFGGCTSSHRGLKFDHYVLKNNNKDCFCLIDKDIYFRVCGPGGLDLRM